MLLLSKSTLSTSFSSNKRFTHLKVRSTQPKIFPARFKQLEHCEPDFCWMQMQFKSHHSMWLEANGVYQTNCINELFLSQTDMFIPTLSCTRFGPYRLFIITGTCSERDLDDERNRLNYNVLVYRDLANSFGCFRPALRPRSSHRNYTLLWSNITFYIRLKFGGRKLQGEKITRAGGGCKIMGIEIVVDKSVEGEKYSWENLVRKK